MSPIKQMPRFLFSLAALLAVTATFDANAQDYPSRTIRIISPVPAGGLSDIAMRPMAMAS